MKEIFKMIENMDMVNLLQKTKISTREISKMEKPMVKELFITSQSITVQVFKVGLEMEY